MARLYLFADESGDFCGPQSLGQSRYFILTTMTTTDCTIGHELLALRRQLAWDGQGINSEFHASDDPQIIRDEVFALLRRHRFRLDTTLLEKAKLDPKFRERPEHLYALAWRLHLRRVVPAVIGTHDELLLVSAAVGTHKLRRTFHEQVMAATTALATAAVCRTTHWAAASEPCLQIVDYCGWAIQRKWERGDTRSSRLVQDRIRTEVDVFADTPGREAPDDVHP